MEYSFQGGFTLQMHCYERQFLKLFFQEGLVQNKAMSALIPVCYQHSVSDSSQTWVSTTL